MALLAALLAPELGVTTREIGPGSVVQAVSLSFELWTGPFLGMAEDCNKRGGRVVGAAGELSCAGVEIVRRLRAAGWNAFWVSEFPCGERRWGAERAKSASLPPAVRALEAKIGMGKAGRPDVVAWHGDTIGYVESKGPSDALKPTQIEWFRRAHEAGVPAENLVLVTWRART